jgi:5-methylcytosine-specific restriction protein A
MAGCGRRQDAAYCADHLRLSPRNHHGLPRQAHGLGADFARANRLVIERDGGRCQLRLKGCAVIATTADHILPRSRGGSAHPSNLRASCGHCNSARGAGQTDTQVGQSSVSRVTRVIGATGRGIESLARPAPARTAWQPRSRAAEFHQEISVAHDVGRPAPQAPEAGDERAPGHWRHRRAWRRTRRSVTLGPCVVGRSPGYSAMTSRSSSAVSPRSWSRSDCSSAPATNAARSAGPSASTTATHGS